MSKAALTAFLILLLAASFASAASIFTSHPASEEDFCFGYAICE